MITSSCISFVAEGSLKGLDFVVKAIVSDLRFVEEFFLFLQDQLERPTRHKLVQGESWIDVKCPGGEEKK